MLDWYMIAGSALTWGLQIVATYGALGLFFVISVEEAGVPLGVPGNMMIVYLGYQVSFGKMDATSILLAIVASTTLGASVLYSVARRGGHPFLHRYGWRIRLDKRKMERVESWIKRHGMGAVIFVRLIPSLRVPTNILSGVFDLPYRAFGPGVAISALLWGSGYLLIGYFLGNQIPYLEALLLQNRNRVVFAVLAVLLMISIALFVEWRRNRLRMMFEWVPIRTDEVEHE